MMSFTQIPRWVGYIFWGNALAHINSTPKLGVK